MNAPDVQQTQFVQNNSQSVPPYHFCTYFNINYLTRGLALYESLVRNCARPFILWVLCFDDETYAILTRLNLSGVRLISLKEFETNDERLLRVKSERSQVEYYWTCTPALLRYVLRHVSEVDVIAYLDADLYFYHDPQPIYDELGDRSILIIEHRYAAEYAHYAAASGIYNVGMMAFRRDENGLACLDWWYERCLEWCYAHYEDGKFGDQKYLDDWPQRFPAVVVLQHPGAGLAPWNLINHKLLLGGQNILVDGKPLVFFHFHSFKFVSANLVEPLLAPYELSARQAVSIFIPYANALTRAADLASQPYLDGFIPSQPRFKLFYGIFRHRYLIVSPIWLSFLLWKFSIGYAEEDARFSAGVAAMKRGDLPAMFRFYFRAVFRNPFLLINPKIILSLFKFITKKIGLRSA